jgi:Domain of unknown function (DUF4277)
VEKALGALPVVADFCQRLDLAGIVDRACPIRQVATLTHGQVIEALVANRLTSPTPLWRVGDWARAWAVTEVFGIAPEALNDDRIGRALDAIAPKLEAIVGSVGARAIAAFGLEVARLHWDMTSIWGEMRPGDPALSARQRAGQRPAMQPRIVVALGGGFSRLEGDGVAKLLELVDQSAGLALGIAAALEPVLAKIVERLAGGEHHPDHDHQAVGDRHGGLFGPRRRAI